MTNYEASKILKFIQRQVRAGSEEDLALQHAMDVLDATDGLMIALNALRERSEGECD